MAEKYTEEKDSDLLANNYKDGVTDEASDPRMNAGQSRRIYSELYKVIDSSDVLIHVLDARDPLGTRCRNVEKYITKEAPHKNIIFILNKCDLVPTWVTVCLSPLTRTGADPFRQNGSRSCQKIDLPWHSTLRQVNLLVKVRSFICCVSSRPFIPTRNKSRSGLSDIPTRGNRVSLMLSRPRKSSMLLRFLVRPRTGNT